MFISKVRPVIIPQSEHLKLAGALAFLWGNGEFDLPPIERSSLAMGVGQHDRGYGYLDNSQVGVMPEADWLEITRRGFGMANSDIAADLIVKHHLIRLANNGQSPARQAMTMEFKQTVQLLLEQHGFAAELFARIDRITDLCDSISVDFCREQQTEGEIRVYPKNDQADLVPVSYSIALGEIRASPWPFAVESYSGYILGYQQSGYPGRTEAVIMPFRLLKK